MIILTHEAPSEYKTDEEKRRNKHSPKRAQEKIQYQWHDNSLDATKLN